MIRVMSWIEEQVSALSSGRCGDGHLEMMAVLLSNTASSVKSALDIAHQNLLTPVWGYAVVPLVALLLHLTGWILYILCWILLLVLLVAAGCAKLF